VPPRAISNPPNPWHSTEVEWLEPPPPARLQVFTDASRSILATNDSPDIGFRWSVNPYRGCTHACAYCYARPWHEYLDFGAGTDFDRKIVVKPEAPRLLREAFDRPKWQGELVVFSGVTDCYQALEASYRLTRGCLEVCRDYANPVGIITKSPLIERDLDVLRELGEVAYLRVSISIPMWRRKNARGLEPHVASPQRRMQTVAALAEAGLTVGVNISPFIPVLSEEGLPELMVAAKEAGASWVGTTDLRLSRAVQPVFRERLQEAFPLRAERILARVRDARGGQLNDPRFGHRMKGSGVYARTSHALFEAAAAKAGVRVGAFDDEVRPTFRRPQRGQLSLL
jgi:DNA repair photolyase